LRKLGNQINAGEPMNMNLRKQPVPESDAFLRDI